MSPGKKVVCSNGKEQVAENMSELAVSGKLDFRQFVLQHFEGGSPEDALAAFKAHCQKVAEAECNTLKGTALFLDLYHPSRQLRFYDWCASLAQARAEAFLIDLQKGKYGRLSLQAQRPPNQGAMTCPVAGHLEPPEYAFDANVGSLWIRGLPPAVSVWEVVDAVQDLDGFVTAAWGTPSEQLGRDFRARFASSEEAQAAMLLLTKEADVLLNNEGLTSGVARVSMIEARREDFISCFVSSLKDTGKLG